MRQLLLSCFVVFLVLGTLRINYYVSSFSLFPTSSTCPASRALGLNRHGKSKTTNLFSSSWQDGIRRLFFSQEGTIKESKESKTIPINSTSTTGTVVRLAARAYDKESSSTPRSRKYSTTIKEEFCSFCVSKEGATGDYTITIARSHSMAPKMEPFQHLTMMNNIMDSFVASNLQKLRFPGRTVIWERICSDRRGSIPILSNGSLRVRELLGVFLFSRMPLASPQLPLREFASDMEFVVLDKKF